MHKWIDYIAVYDRIFEKFRGTDVSILEIGVSHGGSLDIWRKYFGERATIFGVDNDKTCAGKVSPPNQVRIGSQADAEFPNSVVNEMGNLQIVIDDGSHVASHQLASFRALWPRLQFDGLYVIEDTHTSYWPRFGGGYDRKGTAVHLAKGLIDDMHGWFHGRDARYAPAEEIGGMHVFESIFIVEKAVKKRPGMFVVPEEERPQPAL